MSIMMIDQFHRGRLQFHDVLGRGHRRTEGRKVHHAQHLAGGQRRQPQLQAARTGQCALRAYQQMREIHLTIGGVRALALIVEDIQVVAGNPAQDLGPALHDLVTMLVSKLAYEGSNGGGPRTQAGKRPEIDHLPIRQPYAGAQHVMHHVAMGDRA
jgi:hypothetical protein